MLDKSVVFVLGAGASAPYGFPVGSELNDRICSNETYSLECEDYSAADIKRFINAFAQSGQPSIDAFLERRTEFDGIGKLAIALQICKQEDPDCFVQVLSGN